MRIVSRSEWGARHDRGAGPAPLPAKYLHVHHAVTRAANGTAIIRQIEQTGENRFGRGISYTFLITPDGTVYEGHGIDREGSHTRGRNKTGRAICFVGQFHPAEKAIPATRPTAEALEACAQLVAHGHRQGWWPDQITSGHRDAPGASTACPGDWLNAEIPNINRRVRALLATPAPKPPPPAPAPEEDHMGSAHRDPRDGKVWIVTAAGRWHVPHRQALDELVILGLVKPFDKQPPLWPADKTAVLDRIPIVAHEGS